MPSRIREAAPVTRRMAERIKSGRGRGSEQSFRQSFNAGNNELCRETVKMLGWPWRNSGTDFKFGEWLDCCGRLSDPEAFFFAFFLDAGVGSETEDDGLICVE